MSSCNGNDLFPPKVPQGKSVTARAIVGAAFTVPKNPSLKIYGLATITQILMLCTTMTMAITTSTTMASPNFVPLSSPEDLGRQRIEVKKKKEKKSRKKR